MSNFTADYSEKMTSEAAITHSQPPVKRKPKGGKSRFRKVVDWLHRWLGLVSGIVVLILGLTGCLFVFQEEISNVTDRQLRFVAVPAQAHTLPISTLLPVALRALRWWWRPAALACSSACRGAPPGRQQAAGAGGEEAKRSVRAARRGGECCRNRRRLAPSPVCAHTSRRTPRACPATPAMSESGERQSGTASETVSDKAQRQT